MISFQQKTKTIKNAVTGDAYTLQAMDMLKPTENHIERVTQCCNEADVYRWLFREMCDGKPYPRESAADWFESGKGGWQNGTRFGFCVLDSEGQIAAGCDIKSSDPDHAEIGYWSSIQHRGIMTNAVTAMLELAEDVGFRKFYAEVYFGNVRSEAVLKRAGFSLVGQDEKEGLLSYRREPK